MSTQVAPETLEEALAEMDRLHGAFPPPPRAGRLTGTAPGVATATVERDTALRRYCFLSEVCLRQVRREARKLQKRCDQLEKDLAEARLEIRRRNATIRDLLRIGSARAGRPGRRQGGSHQCRT